LQNGLHLAALPSELTGVLTGALLVITISIDRWRSRDRGRVRTEEGVPMKPAQDRLGPPSGQEPAIIPPSQAPLCGRVPQKRKGCGAHRQGDQELFRAALRFARVPQKNSQVAVLYVTILVGSLIVAGTNMWLVHSLKPRPSSTGRRPVIAVMPKAKGDPYFVSCRKGAEEAARELGVDLIWDGPTSLDAAKQNEIVESWITRQVDVIAVAVENQAGISTVLRKARERGIRVLTWDADASPDARDYFINQATAEAIGNTLTDEAARLLGGKGEFAIVTGALSAANQNDWIKFIQARVAAKHPGLKLATIRPSDDDRDKAFAETQTILKVFPSVKLMMAISAPAVPGSAEAVRQAGRTDVNVIGLSLPNICKPYIHDGVVPLIVLWNTNDLGYLTVYAGSLLAENKIPSGAKSIQAGRLGALEIRGSDIILGTPLIIDRSNVDQLGF
jgi:ABC-type sugar transport system substrate-binding protein